VIFDHPYNAEYEHRRLGQTSRRLISGWSGYEWALALPPLR
jgi:hypothetical protein